LILLDIDSLTGHSSQVLAPRFIDAISITTTTAIIQYTLILFHIGLTCCQ